MNDTAILVFDMSPPVFYVITQAPKYPDSET